MLALSVILFVSNGELMELQASESYQKPAMLIWLCHTIMAVLLLVPYPMNLPGLLASQWVGSPAILELSVEYFMCNYLFVSALPYVGLATTNTVYQGSIVFVYVLSVHYLGETASSRKSQAVALCVLGLLCLVLGSGPPGRPPGANSSSSTNPFLGAFIAILASFIFAVFKVRCKQMLQPARPIPSTPEPPSSEGEPIEDLPPAAESHSSSSTLRLLGLLGGCHALFLWPILAGLHLAGTEALEAPSTPSSCLMVLLTAIIALVVNVLSTWSLALSSPLFMSVGFAFSIPLALLADMALRGAQMDLSSLAGMLCVLSSVILMAGVVGAEERRAVKESEDSGEDNPDLADEVQDTQLLLLTPLRDSE